MEGSSCEMKINNFCKIHLSFGKSMKAYMGESDLTSFYGKRPYIVDDVQIHPTFSDLRFTLFNIALIKVSYQIIT